MLSQKAVTPSIVLFTKTMLQWWNAETQAIQNFEFPPETVMDLDVVNEEGFQTNFTEWLVQTNQKPQSVAILLAEEVYFTKDFAATSDKHAIEIYQQQFCEIVPFDNVLCKSFPVESAVRVLAVNKGLYEAVVKTLDEQNFSLENIYPQFLFPVDFSQGLTAANVKDILSNLEKVKDSGLVDPKKKKEEEQKKFIKKQFAITPAVGIAIAVFVFLIAILGVLIWNMQRQNKALEKKNAAQATPAVEEVTTLPSSTPVPIVVPQSSESAEASEEASLQTVKIQVLNGSGTEGKAEEIKDNLEALGAENVTTGNATDLNAGQTLITVRPTITTTARQAIVSAVKDTTSQYSVQEAADLSQYDVIITLGQTGLLVENP